MWVRVGGGGDSGRRPALDCSVDSLAQISPAAEPGLTGGPAPSGPPPAANARLPWGCEPLPSQLSPAPTTPSSGCEGFFFASEASESRAGEAPRFIPEALDTSPREG